jgi:hypothetical protein
VIPEELIVEERSFFFFSKTNYHCRYIALFVATDFTILPDKNNP